MGHGSDKLYVTHLEHAAGGHTAGSGGFQGPKKTHEFERLPFDCCALSLQPFEVPVAVREDDGTANVFDLLNILPYIKKYGLNPVTGRPLATSDLIKLHFHRNSTNNVYSDPVTFKSFTPHTHIVFIANTGNVFAYESIERLCIKAKSWRDLITDEKFTRADIVNLQDPHNMSTRTLSEFDYVKTNKSAKAAKDEDRLSGINVGASGSAAKILAQVAAKNTPSMPVASTSQPKKVGIVATKPIDTSTPYNAAPYSTGRAAASFTSTGVDLHTKSEKALIDEEEFMFDEISGFVKEKDRAKRKGYLRINTNLGTLNYELHCDKAPKTCYNFMMLAKEGKYDDVIFHRNIPGFMVQGGDPTGTGAGGQSYWGNPFRDEYDLKGALKHEERGVLSMANHGAGTNGSQFFIAFRKTPHLDGKHTVFGSLVGGNEVLDKIEAVPSDRSNDRPLKEIKILNVEIFQDPYEAFKKRLANRLAARDQLASADAQREKTRLEREADRTSWFGEDLDQMKEKKAANKRGIEEDVLLSGVGGGVGKYLAAGSAAAAGGAGEKPPTPAELAAAKGRVTGGFGAGGGGGGPAKKRKGAGGGFGDFSAW